MLHELSTILALFSCVVGPRVLLRYATRRSVRMLHDSSKRLLTKAHHRATTSSSSHAANERPITQLNVSQCQFSHLSHLSYKIRERAKRIEKITTLAINTSVKINFQI